MVKKLANIYIYRLCSVCAYLDIIVVVVVVVVVDLNFVPLQGNLCSNRPHKHTIYERKLTTSANSSLSTQEF